VFGGENLLHGTAFVFPFYFLELLIGLVQALVFTLLVSVYIGLICNHGDDHEHDHGHAPTDGHAAHPPATH
jgi:F-type H+-transporting ATPase subunit a